MPLGRYRPSASAGTATSAPASTQRLRPLAAGPASAGAASSRRCTSSGRGAMRRLVQPAGRLLPLQLRHLGAVEGEVGLAPPAGAGGARGYSAASGSSAATASRPSSGQKGNQVTSPLPSSSDRSRARSAAERSCWGAAGVRRRRRVDDHRQAEPSAIDRRAPTAVAFPA